MSFNQVTLTAQYRKPLPGRRGQLETVLELVSRLAVRAALKRSNEPVEVLADAPDKDIKSLTSSSNTNMLRQMTNGKSHEQ